MDRTAQSTTRTATPAGGGRPPRVRRAALAALLGGVLLAAACGRLADVGAGAPASGATSAAPSGPVPSSPALSGTRPSAEGPSSVEPSPTVLPSTGGGAPTSGAPSSEDAIPSDPGDIVSDPVPTGLQGWVFRSTELTGRELAAGKRLQISFAGGDRAGLNAGCNSMGGTPQFVGTTLSMPQVISTMMACEPASVMQQERWYKGWLEQGVSWSLDGDTLTLSGDGVTAVFERVGRADQPTRPGGGDPDAPTGSDGSGTDPSSGSGAPATGSMTTAQAVPPVSPQTPLPGATLSAELPPTGKQIPPTTR